MTVRTKMAYDLPRGNFDGQIVLNLFDRYSILPLVQLGSRVCNLKINFNAISYPKSKSARPSVFKFQSHININKNRIMDPAGTAQVLTSTFVPQNHRKIDMQGASLVRKFG